VPHELHIPSWHVQRISSSHSLARGSSWAGNLGSGLNINTILHMVFSVIWWLFGWHFLWISVQMLSWMMDEICCTYDYRWPLFGCFWCLLHTLYWSRFTRLKFCMFQKVVELIWIVMEYQSPLVLSHKKATCFPPPTSHVSLCWLLSLEWFEFLQLWACSLIWF
jgi:hypothetical protein